MMHKNPKIIIIGAGFAGLTTGYRLHQNGFDVRLFEARKRVGGRVQTVLLKNFEGDYSYAELGGQNISDGGDSPHILNLVNELGLEITTSRSPYTLLFYDEKEYYDVNELFATYIKDIEALEKKLHSIKTTNISLENFIKICAQHHLILERILSFFLKSYEGSPINLLSVEHNIDVLLYFLKRGLSLANEDNTKINDVKWVSLKKGNARLAEKLAEIIGNRVHLNKELISVASLPTGQMMLRFKDQTIEYCDKLVLGVPASVYKDINFEDELMSQTALSDIYNVQYGQHSKILLPIQHQDLKNSFVFTDEMIGFFNQDQRLLNMYIPNMNRTKHISNEDYVHHLKILKDGYQTALFSDALPEIALDENYGRYNAPIYKSWSNDPFSLGSYSNFGIKLGKKFGEISSIQGINVKTMFKPIDNRIFFVGEHTTIIDEIGTMEAAVESGDRMASLIERLA